MIVGVPKEIKNNEFRVSMTPAGVHQFITSGHEVIVESSAGRVTRINRISEEGSRGIGNISTQTSLSSDINPS